MKKIYEVGFYEDGGGFVLRFDWDKDNAPTKENVLQIFEDGTDDNEVAKKNCESWKPYLDMSTLRECV